MGNTIAILQAIYDKHICDHSGSDDYDDFMDEVMLTFPHWDKKQAEAATDFLF